MAFVSVFFSTVLFTNSTFYFFNPRVGLFFLIRGFIILAVVTVFLDWRELCMTLVCQLSWRERSSFNNSFFFKMFSLHRYQNFLSIKSVKNKFYFAILWATVRSTYAYSYKISYISGNFSSYRNNWQNRIFTIGEHLLLQILFSLLW